MKYLVNRETKEHYIQPGMMVPYGPVYDEVEADAEGWIKWDGGECPLPDGQLVKIRTRIEQYNGEYTVTKPRSASDVDWRKHSCSSEVVSYRPILDKPEVESMLKQPECEWPKCSCEKAYCINPPEPTVKESLTVEEDGYEIEHRLSHLLAALEHAHKIAQTIPDLERQLKDFLDVIGYDLVARSPFVEKEND